ncbi:helix-turn-helix domain-containing protein [Sciscionella sediminilitoris]|uniref:helix-turn-helix domain-containing protein n=1 Tax=Sciscionella sediminilitoris TaxID=1445613 RepID=UPI001E49BB43|nr:helix-turn-helix transcriptional regulator [Sciscionella sp. SE31]
MAAKDGIRFRELAKQAGISQSYLSELRTGRKKPTPQVIARLAHAMNVPVSMLEKRIGDHAA